ncbi:hypothetical protein GLAREA_00181 [Glarea lozoyensis ATCC 20868]|uniref:Uncharacterized protein n=1 Tax=Glarea lozoyensis (strain ATCC 20868 / MF5171) TaxID=1116229 RepID=S3DRC4_GLAL2|nr:uncharacterized protein GLAREA_00181 [Glarea lozoyensis ATCC 20868]EPE29023.1 hypothetical protein GLAREA_00181 [Glarea lozoyensis ATCC 20868]
MNSSPTPDRNNIDWIDWPPKIKTPIWLVLWWVFLRVLDSSRPGLAMFLAMFTGISTVEILTRLRSTSSGILQMEKNIEETFPDEKRRLEWYMSKVEELESKMKETDVEASSGSR